MLPKDAIVQQIEDIFEAGASPIGLDEVHSLDQNNARLLNNYKSRSNLLLTSRCHYIRGSVHDAIR